MCTGVFVQDMDEDGRCGGSMCTGVFVQDRDEVGGVEDLCVLVCLHRTGIMWKVWRIYVYWCVCTGQG